MSPFKSDASRAKADEALATDAAGLQLIEPAKLQRLRSALSTVAAPKIQACHDADKGAG